MDDSRSKKEISGTLQIVDVEMRNPIPRSLPLPPSSFDCGNDNVYSGETLTAVPLQDKNVRELMEDITCDILKEKNAARPPPPISIGGSSSTQKAENALSAVSSIAVSYSCKECEYTSGRCNTLATHIVDTHQPGTSTFSTMRGNY